MEKRSNRDRSPAPIRIRSASISFAFCTMVSAGGPVTMNESAMATFSVNRPTNSRNCSAATFR